MSRGVAKRGFGAGLQPVPGLYPTAAAPAHHEPGLLAHRQQVVEGASKGD